MSFSLEELKKQSSTGSTLKTSLTITNTSKQSSLVAKDRAGLTSLKEVLNQDRNVDTKIQEYSQQVISQVSKIMEEESLEIVFVFDKSGSCAGTEYDTIKGFNNLIKRQKGKNTIVTTVLFNKQEFVIQEREDISKVQPLNYSASGGTALYDTLCSRISKVKRQQQASSSIPKHTLFVIMTDGADEDSKSFNLAETRAMIEERQNAGWEFIFMAAKIDAKKVAAQLGIKQSNAQGYNECSIEENFKAVEIAMDNMRECGHVKPEWSTPIKNSQALLEEKSLVYRLGGK